MTLELAHIRALIEAGFLRWLADHEAMEMLGLDTAQIPKQHQPRAYSPATLAEHWSVSAETIRRLIKIGELQALQYGRSWRITAQAVEEYENRNMLYSPSDDRSA